MPAGQGPLACLRRAQVYGLLGNTKKRLAEHLAHRVGRADAGARAAARAARAAWTAPDTVEEALREARDDYREAFRLSMSEVWALVQSIALGAALGEGLSEDEWTTAHTLASEQLKATREPLRLAWAHAALAELYVLSQRLPEGHPARVDAAVKAHMHVAEMLERIAPDSADAYSTRRQLERYSAWWWRDEPALCALPKTLVAELERRGVPAHVEPG